MEKNNFDQSSSGINIELFLGYDIDLAGINFEDNFELIDSKFIFYKDYGNMELNENLDYYFNVEDTKENRKGLLKALHSLEYFTGFKLECYTTYYLFQQLLICSYAVLKNLNEIKNLLSTNNVKFSTNFECVEITGYNQRDYNTILVDKKQFKAVNGVDFDSKVYRRRFKHYCYDSPLSCRAVINNKEYYPETLDGQYVEFDKEIFITDIIKQVKNIDIELLTKELEDLVPEEVGY